MKRIVIFILCATLFLSLCACSLSEKKADEYIERIYQCSTKDYKEEQKLASFLNKYGEDDVFVNAVIKRIEAEDLGWCISFLKDLADSRDSRDRGVYTRGHNFKYYNERVKEAFQTKIFAVRDSVFQGTGDISFVGYCGYVFDYGEGGDYELEYYFPQIVDCLPYDACKDYIVNHYNVAITKKGQGGYYDGEEEYSSSSIHDPLGITDGSSYELGTYRSSASKEYAGDFYLHSYSETWWGTDSRDTNNSSKITLYFRGEEIDIGLYANETRAFMSLITSGGETYYANNTFFVVQEDSISVGEPMKLITVQYSNSDTAFRKEWQSADHGSVESAVETPAP